MTQSLLFTFAESKVRLELGSNHLGVGVVVGTLLDADHTGVLLGDETGCFAFYPWSTIHHVEILDASVKPR